MSAPEAPVPTEAQQILAKLDQQAALMEQLIGSYNAIGANLQWLVDNVKGIFEMFGNPAFMSQMSAMTGAFGGGNKE